MQKSEIYVLQQSTIFSKIKKRPQNSHKGSFGTALCICGSQKYRGAALLATEATLRCGAGIVQLASIEQVLSACCIRLPEATLLPLQQSDTGAISKENRTILSQELQNKQSILMGCGLTQSEDIFQLVHDLVPLAQCSVVLDADALNVCNGEKLPRPQQGRLILTPHPGEMARLCNKTVEYVQNNRSEIAMQFAKEKDCILVLKGYHTLIASPDGQIFENHTGNSGLAKGGSGDVLAGMITGLLCSGMDPFDAAICGVYLHGYSADLCAARKGETSMLPHEILQDLSEFLAQNGR